MTENTYNILFESKERNFIQRAFLANWIQLLFYTIFIISFNTPELFGFSPSVEFNIIFIPLLFLNLVRYSYWYRFSLISLELNDSELSINYLDFNTKKSFKSSLHEVTILSDRPFTIGILEILVIRKNPGLNLRFFRFLELTNSVIRELVTLLNEKKKLPLTTATRN